MGEGAHLAPSPGVASLRPLTVGQSIPKSVLSILDGESSLAWDHGSITIKNLRQESAQSPNSWCSLYLGQNR